MTKEEMVKAREDLVKEQGELMNKKRNLAKASQEYVKQLTECKKVIGLNNYFLRIDTIYEKGSPEQVAHANLYFYKKSVERVRNEIVETTKRLREVSKLIAKYEIELGYNKEE